MSFSLPVDRAPQCPLCKHAGSKQSIQGPDARSYLHCPRCHLIFVTADHLPSPSEERLRYLQHNNSADDSGYVSFLESMLLPLLPKLQPGVRGLDYGCGPQPVLAELMRARGFNCEVYDPFFFASEPLPPYDFALSTECFEHFHHPRQDIGRICTLLAPSAWLGIMTELWQTAEAFATWSYARDTTHVVFYHRKTLHLLTDIFPLELHFCDRRRVALFRKKFLTNSGR